jgi:hypothetical protein
MLLQELPVDEFDMDAAAPHRLVGDLHQLSRGAFGSDYRRRGPALSTIPALLRRFGERLPFIDNEDVQHL